MISDHVMRDCLERLEASIQGFKFYTPSFTAWKEDLESEGLSDEDIVYGTSLLRKAATRAPSLGDMVKFCNEARTFRQQAESARQKREELKSVGTFWDSGRTSNVAATALSLIHKALDGHISQGQLITAMKEAEKTEPRAGWAREAAKLEKGIRR